ncbi:MAG: D-alanine--D-alanine ligase [bacterium]|nr:D-alanine--D-alanine ligase [bacterium]
MGKKKIRVGVLCGGKSAEHEVSLQSARNVVAAMDKEKYEVVLIGIDKTGQWYLNDASRLFLDSPGKDLPAITGGEQDAGVSLVAQGAGAGQLMRASSREPMESVDVIFPVLHGPFGEDGTVQGMLKLANLPFVGASVLGSAVGMDKDVMKRLLRDAGIPGPDFMVLTRRSAMEFDAVVERLGLPFFVKPANLGSSVGVSRVNGREEFDRAIEEAFRYDSKVLIEAFIQGREIECSVLGNEDPIASVPGEVIPQHAFYSYEAKYLDESGALLKIPAELPEVTVQKVQELAVRTFQVLCCEGMARVDFFLRGEDEVLVNEINTIPGFTRISMYPKLWEASGVPPSELVDRLIELAVERFERERGLKTSYT